jgi:uncharacterized protein YeaO (DUF488 family)
MLYSEGKEIAMIRIKRVYEPESSQDGKRYLVDRLWPRGLKKESLHLAGWFKEIAPSNELRKWFGHDPEKWEEFQRRYLGELRKSDSSNEDLTALKQAADETDVTLLYGAHDEEHNNAVVLKEFLDHQLHKKTTKRKK